MIDVSLGQFRSLIEGVPGRFVAAEMTAMELAGRILVEDAQSRIGSSPESAPGPIGPFPGWAPLADWTIQAKGFDNILLETGAFQEDIHAEPRADGLLFYTNTEYAIYHELGTVRMPPRPVFGPVILENMPVILELVGSAWVAAYTGQGVTAVARRRPSGRGGAFTGLRVGRGGQLRWGTATAGSVRWR